jgi:hypothetical protein
MRGWVWTYCQPGDIRPSLLRTSETNLTTPRSSGGIACPQTSSYRRARGKTSPRCSVSTQSKVNWWVVRPALSVPANAWSWAGRRRRSPISVPDARFVGRRRVALARARGPPTEAFEPTPCCTRRSNVTREIAERPAESNLRRSPCPKKISGSSRHKMPANTGLRRVAAACRPRESAISPQLRRRTSRLRGRKRPANASLFQSG